MSITLRTARLEELPRILSCLDQEFVFVVVAEER